MATGTAQRGPQATPPAKKSDGQWIEYDQFIDDQLRKARGQVKGVELAGSLMTLAAGSLLFFLVVSVADHWLLTGGLGFWGRLACLVLFVAGLAWYIGRRLAPLVILRINPIYAAETIERSKPSLKNSLINFLFLRNEPAGVPKVIYEAVEQQAARGLQRTQVEATVDRSRLIHVGYVLLALVAIFGAYKVFSPKDPVDTVARVVMPWADIQAPTRVTIHDVRPGNHTAYLGETVEVSAELRGIGADEPVRILYTTADRQTVDQAVTMYRPAEGFRHVGKIPAGDAGLQQDIEYHIEAGDAVTPMFRLQAAAAPTIAIERIDYEFPAYTRKTKSHVENTGDIQALEGTLVTIHGRANQPLKSAQLVLDGEGRHQQVPMKIEGRSATAAFPLALDEKDRATPLFSRYQLRPDDRAKPEPAQYKIDVFPDLPPEVKFLAPEKDEVEVPANGSLALEVRAADPDFALAEVTLSAESDEKPVLDKKLLSAPHEGPLDSKFVFQPGRLGLKEGDSVSYWATAKDNRTPTANEAHTAHRQIRIVKAEQRRPSSEAAAGDANQNQANQNPNDNSDDPSKPKDEQHSDHNTKDQSNNPNDQQSPDADNNPDNKQGSQNDKAGRDNRQQDKQSRNADKQKGNQQQGDNQQGNKQQDGGQQSDKQQGKKQQGDKNQGDKQQGEKQQGGKQDSGGGSNGQKSSSGDSGDGAKQNSNGNSSGAANPQDSGQKSDDPSHGDKSSAKSSSAGQSGKSDDGSGSDHQQSSPDNSADAVKSLAKTLDQQNQQRLGASGQSGGKQAGQQGAQNDGQSSKSSQPGSSGDGASDGSSSNPSHDPKGSGGPFPNGKPGTGSDKSAGEKSGHQPNDADHKHRDKPDGAQNAPDDHNGGKQSGDQQSRKQQTASGDRRDAGDKAESQQESDSNQMPNDSQKSTSSGDQHPGNDQSSKSGPSDKSSEKQQPGDKTKSGDKPPGDGKLQGAGKQQGSQQSNAASKSQTNDKAQGEDKSQAGDNGQKGNQVPSDKSSEPSGSKTNAGEKPSADNKNSNAENGENKSGTSDPSKQGKGAQAKQGSQPSDQKHDQADSGGKQQPDAKGGDPESMKGNPGSGEKGNDKGGSPSPQEGNKPKENKSDSNDGKSAESSDSSNNAKSPSTSPKESNSKGGEEGDRSGGGKAGAGQSANQAGTGGAGQNSAADEGKGKSQGAGKGEDSSQPGSDKQSDHATGQAGNQSGNGSASSDKPSNEGSASNQPGDQGQGGGGDSGAGGNRTGPLPDGVAPGGGPTIGDEANMDFAKKQFDLALDRLKKGNPDLLKELNWTPADARNLAERLEQMKSAAKTDGPEGDRARRNMNDLLRNLGSRAGQISRSGDRSASDKQHGLQESNDSGMPSEYRDQFEAFQQGALRGGK